MRRLLRSWLGLTYRRVGHPIVCSTEDPWLLVFVVVEGCRLLGSFASSFDDAFVEVRVRLEGRVAAGYIGARVGGWRAESGTVKAGQVRHWLNAKGCTATANCNH
jgi:hypothetical protein